jgi:CheY-like chemotaxis protein
LLSNSVKFTSKGGRIEIRLERKNTNAQLTVSDSGEGIRPEFLPYVFDRFRQEDSSRTRKHGGLGLGLSIVQHLIEMHGGAVEAHSAGEGHGASFTVTLPLTRQTVDLETLQNRPQAATTQSTLAGMQLVIVEDDPDSLEMLRMVVRLHGADVRTATTTAEALEMLQQQLPDVLVADIGLPDEDGYTLIRRTKMLADEKNKHVRAIALTGYAGEQEGKRALASGFQLYLSKPTEPRRLVEAIAALVRHEKSAVPRSD